MDLFYTETFTQLSDNGLASFYVKTTCVPRWLAKIFDRFLKGESCSGSFIQKRRNALAYSEYRTQFSESIDVNV